jgi:anti-sigma factor RsiW
MTWRCALVQPRLPAFPDGDLSPFWRRVIAAHLKACPECRRELEELTEVVRLYQSQPLPDPGEAFWQEFDRELHVKLAQVNQAPEPQPRRLRLPHYVMGATALAGVFALAVYLGPFMQSSSTPKVAGRLAETKSQEVTLRQEATRAKRAPAAAPAPPPVAAERSLALPPAEKPLTSGALLAEPAPAPAKDAAFSLAAGKAEKAGQSPGEEDDLWADDDILSWDVDSLVADLSQEEKQVLKSRLESRR